MQGNEPEVILAAFPLLAAAAIGAVGAGIGAYGKYKAAERNRPMAKFKQRAFKQKANTGYLKRYMADLRGRSGNRARTELAMRPALRAIGAQQQQGQRMLAYQSAQQGLEGSGIEAQKQLALQQGTTQATAGLGEKVLNQQLTQARQMQAQKEGQRMKLAGEIGRQEGAIAQANRLSEFRTSETNRQADFQTAQEWEQYDRNLKNIKTEGWTNVAQGALKGASPFIMDEAGYEGEARNILGYKGGGLVKGYQGGGDVVAGLGAGYTKEEELKKKYQTEYDVNLEGFKTREAAFPEVEAERKKQIEESNLLVDQQFEKSEKDKLEADKERFKTEALKSLEYDKQKALFETGEGRRDVLGSQKKTTKLLKKEGIKDESGEEIYGTKGLTGENVEGALDYLKTNPEEYNVLKEKADVLKEYGLGEKQYDKAKEHYATMSEKYAGTEGIPQTFEEYLQKAIDTDQTEFWGKDLSKRGKKKLSKKYDKKTLALLQSQGKPVEEGKYEEALETKDPGEDPGMDFERTAPGEAPTKQEYVAQEFSEEAPTLQEPTEREIYDLRKKEIKKQLRAGIDVKANIAKAMEANVYSGLAESLETRDPNAIMAQVSSSDPEYAKLLESDPKKAFTMRKSARIEADKIASSNSSDALLATEMNDAKRGIDTILWAVGDDKTSEAIMEVLDEAGNEESITEAHLETIRGLLDNMSPSASGETNLKAQLDANEITEDQYNFRLDILKQIGKDNSGIKKQVLSKLNKEKFVRDEVKKVSPWDDSPEVISETK